MEKDKEDNVLVKNEIRDEFEKKMKHIHPEYYLAIKDVFKSNYDWPEIEILKHEICLCIMFGLYQAGMSLTNHMLETLVKISITYYDSLEIDKEKFLAVVDELQESNKKYSGENLYKTIEIAFKLGLISEAEKQKLHTFREDFRNSFSHADREKLYKGEKTNVTEFRGDGKKINITGSDERKLFEIVFAHGFLQYNFCEVNCIRYLIEMDEIIKNIRGKLFGNKKT